MCLLGDEEDIVQTILCCLRDFCSCSHASQKL